MAIVSEMSETLTITTTKQDLYTLLSAINGNAPRTVCKVEIQGDDAQAGVAVFVGDNRLTDTNYAMKILSSGDIYSDNSENKNAIALNKIFLKVIAAGANQPMHTRVRVF